MAIMHFVTGKGGVGKSTYAASLAKQLAEKSPSETVLLIDIQGSGYSLELVGIEKPNQTPSKSQETHNLWGCRILPFETFKEYFSVLLALGNTDTPIAQITSGIRDRMVNLVVGNPAIEAFIHACPGLEPAVLLGKLEYEAEKGKSPDKKSWTHIVVDAPATGHSLMLFRSTFALLEVFGTGVVFKQARQIKDFAKNRAQFKVHLISIPEELPVKETYELKNHLLEYGVEVSKAILNRSPLTQQPDTELPKTGSEELDKELEIENFILKERAYWRSVFLEQHQGSELLEIPEFIFESQAEVIKSWRNTTHLT